MLNKWVRFGLLFPRVSPRQGRCCCCYCVHDSHRDHGGGHSHRSREGYRSARVRRRNMEEAEGHLAGCTFIFLKVRAESNIRGSYAHENDNSCNDEHMDNETAVAAQEDKHREIF